MAAYRLESPTRFLNAMCSITQSELHPQNTVTLISEVDLTEVESIRRRSLAGSKPSYTAFVAKAVALALREFPYANRRLARLPFLGLRLQTFQRIDAAILCEREMPEAPMLAFVDVIRNADNLSLSETTERLRALATCDESNNKQWREFKTIITTLPSWIAQRIIGLPLLFPSLWMKYRGGAFSISSPAKYGVDSIVATWPWPLGVSFGLVKPRAVIRNGQVVVRTTFNLTLNFDRRIMAGAQAARFFKRIVDILENATIEMEPYLPATAPVSNGASATKAAAFVRV